MLKYSFRFVCVGKTTIKNLIALAFTENTSLFYYKHIWFLEAGHVLVFAGCLDFILNACLAFE